jgi:hypothetical protein
MDNNIDLKEVGEKLAFINSKEPEVAQAIYMVIDHIHGTYSDKYAKGIEGGIDTKVMLYNAENGGAINTYQISRYLQRYITKGSRKSGLLKDLLKMIHYTIFEIVRRIKADDINLEEPKE